MINAAEVGVMQFSRLVYACFVWVGFLSEMLYNKITLGKSGG